MENDSVPDKIYKETELINPNTFLPFSIIHNFVNKSSMLQIKIVVELKRSHLVSLKYSDSRLERAAQHK